MNLGHCTRESEVLASLKNNHWPQSCDPQLLQHVAACTTCGETVMLKSAFQTELAKSRQQARLDSPGLIWWRAQLRRRHAALERVSKPVTFAHVFAMAICIVAAASFAAVQIRNAGGWLALLDRLKLSATSPSEVALSITSFTQDWSLMVLLPCAVAIALVGGVVVYLASD